MRFTPGFSLPHNVPRHYNITQASRECRIHYKTFCFKYGQEAHLSFFIIFTNLYIKVYILEETIILKTCKTKEDEVIKMVNIFHEIKENFLIFIFVLVVFFCFFSWSKFTVDVYSFIENRFSEKFKWRQGQRLCL